MNTLFRKVQYLSENKDHRKNSKNDGPFSQDPTIEQSCVRVLTVIIFKLEPIDADSFFSPSLVYMWCMCV